VSAPTYQARLFTPAGALDETFRGPFEACRAIVQAWALELCADALARDSDPVLAGAFRDLAASLGDPLQVPEYLGADVRVELGGWVLEVSRREISRREQ